MSMMIKTALPTYLALLLLLICMSCEGEIVELDIDYGYDYYPLVDGSQWIYQYDSVLYLRQFGTVDTVSGYLRERLVADADDPDKYSLERDWRRDTTQSWRINSIWSIRLEENKLIRVEENLPFTKLVFPIEEGLRWDGLAMIDRDISVSVAGDPIRIYALWDDYRVSSISATEAVGDRLYDDVITVTENITEDLGRLELRNSTVKYARGVGIVAIEHTILECSDCDPNISWDEKGDKGYTLHQYLIDYK
jgi:hypothetical protein